MSHGHQKQSGSKLYRPGGLILPIHATLRGVTRWQVLDERNVPEVPRTPSGIPIGPAEGLEHSNLITDLGLNRMGSELDCQGTAISAVDTWRRRLAVGTGSTAPSASDTTLDFEVQRDADSDEFPDGTTVYELDGVNNVWNAEITVTRLVTMDQDRNLTEYGFANELTDDILIRELLRDGVGTPITVSLLAGKKIRVDHTLIIQLPAPDGGIQSTVDIEEYDVGNNLIGTTTYNVTHGGTCRLGVTAAKVSNIFRLWNPHWSLYRIEPLKTTWVYSKSDNPFSLDSALNTSLTTYSYNTYTRTKRVLAAAGELNFAWYGFITRRDISGTQDGAWGLIFDSPTTYTKVDTNTIRTGWVTTWARA